ncbi:DUF317 domain-containing protein [Streptomyces albidoflavus]|uniref:DUF317 domain-containing protein n=1 Tax=Streptomyces TaxID=1883 RepID=UPI00203A578D|nr:MULTISPECIES: DUF317 domain-containing protein [unclassified Streptomyces]
MNTSDPLLSAVGRTSREDLNWPTTDHSAGPVLELLTDLGWAIVETPEANIHATSPDGRAYVGWLPEDPAARKRDIVWHIRVQPIEGAAWSQEFGTNTPSEAVAGFLGALVMHCS